MASDRSVPDCCCSGIISSESQTQKHKGKRKVSEGPVVKAHWDSKANETFIKLCANLVKDKHRPGTHFTKLGWCLLQRQLCEHIGRMYSILQLKNHWDVLKKEWQLWQSLIMGETSLGMNHEKGTIDASDDWWRNKLQKIPVAAKFREKGLSHLEELDIMFLDTAATSEYAWAPSSGVLPPHTRGEDCEEVESDDNAHDNITLDMEMGCRIEKTKKRRVECNTSLSSNQGKGKRISSADMLTRTLNRIVDALESSIATSTRTDTRGCTIPEVLNILSNLPGIIRGDPLFMLGTRLFIHRQQREMFVALGDSDLRLQWLIQEQKEASRILSHL